MYEDLKKQRTNPVIILIALSALMLLGAVFLTTRLFGADAETQADRMLRIEAERDAFFEALTREQILYDFDYMMHVLEHNYPYFDL